MPRQYSTAVVACARWEEDFILEWVTYYKCIGYEHIFLYCNDDDPAGLYDKLLPFTAGAKPFVTFVHFPYQGLQYQMYMHFIANYAAQVMWVSFFDIDEFLRLADGGTIGEFLARFDDDVDCILFNWVVFGTSFHKTNPAGLVLENYTRRAADLNSYTKFIGRASLLQDSKLRIPDLGFGFWHSLYGKLYRPVKLVNVLGSTERAERYDEATARRIENVAVLHHYIMKSEAYALHRARRGTQGAFAGQAMWDPQGEKARKVMAEIELFNAVEDRSLAHFWADRRAEAAAHSIAPKTRGQLLSRNKNCTQSSLSAWSIGATLEQDAAGAVNGVIDGREKFHTEREAEPWWQIDLGAVCRVDQILIYNAAFHTRERFTDFRMLISMDGQNWLEEYRKADGRPVGGLLTGPFIHDLQKPIFLRFLRIVSMSGDYLHLDQVEIYGAPPVV